MNNKYQLFLPTHDIIGYYGQITPQLAHLMFTVNDLVDVAIDAISDSRYGDADLLTAVDTIVYEYIGQVEFCANQPHELKHLQELNMHINYIIDTIYLLAKNLLDIIRPCIYNTQRASVIKLAGWHGLDVIIEVECE